MTYFTSRAIGQIGGKMKCKCNAMQVVVLVVVFYSMDLLCAGYCNFLKYVY